MPAPAGTIREFAAGVAASAGVKMQSDHRVLPRAMAWRSRCSSATVLKTLWSRKSFRLKRRCHVDHWRSSMELQTLRVELSPITEPRHFAFCGEADTDEGELSVGPAGAGFVVDLGQLDTAISVPKIKMATIQRAHADFRL